MSISDLDGNVSMCLTDGNTFRIHEKDFLRLSLSLHGLVKVLILSNVRDADLLISGLRDIENAFIKTVTTEYSLSIGESAFATDSDGLEGGRKSLISGSR